VEKEEAEQFKVVVTKKAEIYFYELAQFMYDNMGLDRAEEIILELQKAVKSLSYFSNRGTIENNLTEEGGEEFRYLLVKRTPRSQVKVIYFVNPLLKTGYVTDFFPTEKDIKQLKSRSS
jgi:plasmid stabilization system protein ParE